MTVDQRDKGKNEIVRTGTPKGEIISTFFCSPKIKEWPVVAWQRDVVVLLSEQLPEHS